MQDAEHKHWLDQLEVTGPIKGIMSFVDELSRNYDRRLAALHIDYQKDVEEILACYKSEKQEFSTQLEEQKTTIASLENELKALQQNYKTMNIEYKISQECLKTTQLELTELTKALKKEEELMTIATEKIQVTNEQLRLELAARGVAPAPAAETVAELFIKGGEELATPVVRPKRLRFRRTRAFFKQVVADRLTRPIILRPKQEPIMTDNFDVQDKL